MRGKALSLVNERNYWKDVSISFAQVTFGIFWASIFLPIDRYKIIVIILNIIITVLLITTGLFLTKKRKL